MTLYYVLGVLGVLLLMGGGYQLGRYRYDRQLAQAKGRAADLLREARLKAEAEQQARLLQAERQIALQRAGLEERINRREAKLDELESRLLKRESRLESKAGQLEQTEKSLSEDLQRVEALISQGELLLSSEQVRLEAQAGLSSAEARAQLLQLVEAEAQRFFAKRISLLKEQAQAQAEREARKIIATAIQRYASDEVEISTVSLVPLPNDDYKGRVIGREGRNIRAFEALTGVEVLVDDTPDTVVLSCFHPIRREVARMAMEKLVEDGRIHPAQIKKQVDKAKEQVAARIKEEGQRAVLEAGLEGLHPELVMLLGRLAFRTSYGQNQLRHSLEVSFIAGALASELGLDPKQARRAGLLHDIGKAVDHQVEGSHSLISTELARRYGESEEVVQAILAHNEEVEPQAVLDILIQAADALSAARPGARQETFTSYIQRLSDLESICQAFPGVSEAYAIQAGREVRVMVRPEEVNDDLAAKLSYDIARCIEEELHYPGEIKVQVIRSIRFSESAR
ncbi:MAG TPA: ribonuclease Y [Candidatus Fraserbacteria bacterium]|nr:ribonuclease Y [Candidatus Fraserbacteria bacterium]